MKFGVKLFVLFLGLSLVMLALTALVLYLVVFKRMETDEKLQAQSYAASVSTLLSGFINGDDHEAAAEGDSVSHHKLMGMLERGRKAVSSEHVFIDHIYTMKQQALSDSLTLVLESVKDSSLRRPRTFVQPNWQNEGGVANVSDFYRRGGKYYLSASSPIENDNGLIVGYAYVDLDVSRLRETAGQLRTRLLAVEIIVFLILIIISIVMSLYLSRTINRPLVRLREGLMHIKDGEFNYRLPADFRDEFKDLALAFNAMTDQMREMAVQLSSSSKKILESSNEIVGVAREQASTSSQQSISVTETTATMEELSSTSKYIAEHSESVTKIADETHEVSHEGVELSQVTREKMEEIRRKSQKDSAEIIDLSKKMQKITDVMGIINNITEQTKLISFNAALEATGAGEAGKRFSVVAAEIRRLAENVAESTEEIKTTVVEIRSAMDALTNSTKESANKILEGVEFVNQVGSVLEKILTAAQKTAEAAKQISLSTQQQRTASEQVVTTLKEISEGAKHFVKSSNQAASVAGDLHALSEELKTMLTSYKFN
ncbi:MAG: methyl-accepting chemotaxis protein [Bacteroidetes bacterium]|nr:methyl-accepting chemotaxis protein [Bacteroidota bacterium]